MMRMPDLVCRADCCHKPQHVQISANHAGIAQPGQSAPSHIDYLNVLADLRETVGCVIGTGIKNHLVALPDQLARQTDALPLTAAFHQQFMHD
jgi:hypothetical protein